MQDVRNGTDSLREVELAADKLWAPKTNVSDPTLRRILPPVPRPEVFFVLLARLRGNLAVKCVCKMSAKRNNIRAGQNKNGYLCFKIPTREPDVSVVVFPTI